MPFLSLEPYEKQKKQIAQDTGLSQETLDTIGDVLDMIAPSTGAAGMASGLTDQRERSLFNRLGFLGALTPFAVGAFLGRPKKSQPGAFGIDVEPGNEVIQESMLGRMIKEKGVKEGILSPDVSVSTVIKSQGAVNNPRASILLWDVKKQQEVDISESDLERILPNRQEMLMLETESRGTGIRQSFTKTMDDIKQAAGPKGQEKSVSDMRLAAPKEEPVSVEFAGKGVRNSKVNSFLRMLKLKPTDDPDELFVAEETMGVIGKRLGSSDLTEVLDELGVPLIQGAGNLGYLVKKRDGYRLTAKGARQLLIANGLKER